MHGATESTLKCSKATETSDVIGLDRLTLFLSHDSDRDLIYAEIPEGKLAIWGRRHLYGRSIRRAAGATRWEVSHREPFDILMEQLCSAV